MTSRPGLRKGLVAAAAGVLGSGCVLGILTVLGGSGFWLAAGGAGLFIAGALLVGAHRWTWDRSETNVDPPGAKPDGRSTEAGLGTLRGGGVLPAVEAMLRFEEELALANDYGRPLCIALAGIDVAPGLDLEDAMEGLRQLIAGAVRRNDLVTDRDLTSILIMAPETSAALGWTIVDRIQQRAAAAGVGTVRFVLIGVGPHDSLRSILDELDAGLQVCRLTDELFADPTRMLASRA